MATSTIAIIILVGALILYLIPKMPLSVTTLLAILAMVAFGVTDFSSVTTGFANKVIFLNAGMMILGQAMVSTGVAQKIGELIIRANLGRNERIFMMLIFVVSTLMAVFINGAIVAATLMPVIDAVVLQSGGKVRRKQIYMPLGIGSTIGNNVLTISATSMLTAVALLEEMGYGTMSLTTPLAVNLPAVIVVLIFWAMVGQKLQEKWYDFDEAPVALDPAAASGEKKEYSTFKQVAVIVIFVAAVIAMLCKADYGLASLFAAVAVILTGCISEKDALKSVSWSTIVVIGGSLGFSAGIKASGAGEIIANFFLDISGPLGQSGLGMSLVLFFIASVLSAVMMDNPTVAIMLPITAAIADTTGYNAIPLFLAVCSGTKVGITTPFCVTPMAMVAVPGYRFKDYLRAGGCVNIICMIVTVLMIGVVYFW